MLKRLFGRRKPAPQTTHYEFVSVPDILTNPHYTEQDIHDMLDGWFKHLADENGSVRIVGAVTTADRLYGEPIRLDRIYVS